MSGYVASARIVRAAPHLMRREPVIGRTGATSDRPDGRLVEVIEASNAGSPGVSIAERYERLRDRLGQLTFYLTSPESWR